MTTLDPRNAPESLARDAERGSRNAMAFRFVRIVPVRRRFASSPHLRLRNITGMDDEGILEDIGSS